MAVVPVCYKLPYKDQILPRHNSARQHERGLVCVCSASPKGCISTDARKRLQVIHQGNFHLQNMSEASVLPRVWSMKGENFCRGSFASKTSANEKQLRLLDSYFGKLQCDANYPSSDSSDETTELVDENRQVNAMVELQSLNSYLDKLSKDANLKHYVSSTFDDQTTEEKPLEKLFAIYEDSQRGDEEKTKSFIKLRKKDANSRFMRSQDLQQNDEPSDLYLISVLVAINIAVFLFELASPVRNSEFELFTLPLLYGAKINDLILVGEWWRLVTPMFLVQD